MCHDEAALVVLFWCGSVVFVGGSEKGIFAYGKRPTPAVRSKVLSMAKLDDGRKVPPPTGRTQVSAPTRTKPMWRGRAGDDLPQEDEREWNC